MDKESLTISGGTALVQRLYGALAEASPFYRPAKYGYSNARVSSMKSLLLKKEFLQELVRVRSIDAVIGMLERTPYKEELVKLSMKHHGSELVEVAAARHFASVAKKLVRIAPGEDRKAVDVLLTKWDVVNTKILLNARLTGKAYQDVAPFLMPLESLDEGEAKSLFEGKGTALFMRFVKTRLGKGLVESGMVSSTELEKIFMHFGNAEIMKLELLLDRFYYSLYRKSGMFQSREMAPIAKTFATEIDLKNATTIIRLKRHGVSDRKSISRFLMKDGSKPLKSFDQMIEARDEKDTLKAAAQLFGLKAPPAGVVELEMEFEKMLGAAKVRAFYRTTLSLGTLLGFLLLNIRKIATAKEFGTPDKKIEEMLVFQN
ncbi:MAG: V-type ATPase subunit [Candidatus Micrarchaeia archaeon]